MSATFVEDAAGGGFREALARRSRERAWGGDGTDLLSARDMAEALEAGIALRAPVVGASAAMVRQIAVQVCRRLGLGEAEQQLAEVCARVRDVGMLGLPDSVVLATGPLSPADWELVNRHPSLGAELVAGLTGMGAVAEVVRAHHERWDGEGYPDGIRGDKTPILSRVIAVADAFVAIASDRPYRKSVGAEAALEQICQESGTQFDSRIVEALVGILSSSSSPASGDRLRGERNRSIEPIRGGPTEQRGRQSLKNALAGFDVLPAFGPAYERALKLAQDHRETGGELVATIESDLGLTVAVLRGAWAVGGKRQIANIADSVTTLTPGEIRETISALPRAAFPWRTGLEARLHAIRVHGQAVARAVDRIAREVGFDARDDLIAAALLHDIGKLVLWRLGPASDRSDERSETPERRVRAEQQALSVDHASLGSLLLQRWSLPRRLSDAVAAHHTADTPDELATFLRLADMIARHAHGDPVDRAMMLKLTRSCGLPVPTLREILFDLPHTGGSQRRRALPSPLSSRETTVLRILAQGKLYKEIARETGLTTSTVRSHLHNIYRKVGVDDRARAVLRATEMGWL